MPAEKPSRRDLLRWVGWFGAANAAIFAVILLRYLWGYPFTGDLLGNLYLVLAFAGHAAKLAFLPLIIIVIPLLLVAPIRGVVVAAAVILTSIAASLLILDANLFAENRYHLSWLTFQIMEWSTWFITGVFFLIGLVFESLLAGIVWRRLTTGSLPLRGRWVGVGVAACLLISQSIHVWADAVGHTPVVQLTRYMPFYHAMKAKRMLGRLGIVDAEQVQQRRLLSRSSDASDGELDYPLQPMRCTADPETLPNILLVMIDGLRPDVIAPELLPELAAFSQRAARFGQHYSGGNSTRMGLFSLFYGIPGTYWQSFYALQRSPVLMDQVRDNDYQMGLFSAIGFGSPFSADRTAFVAWPGLPAQAAGKSILEQNARTTEDWLAWLAERQSARPFFGYLHYAPPKPEMTGRLTTEAASALPLSDWFRGDPDIEEDWLRYRLAMQSIDGEFGRIMKSLQSRELSDETIVIVTSDHGSEFDDNGLGYKGHGTAFSRPQLLSMMTIAWPGREPADYSHRTSHYDLPVTLLQDVFGCDNPVRDYSVGKNLFSGESWSWLLAGSYNAKAIIEPEQVIVSHPGGYAELRDQNYRPAGDLEVNAAVVKEAMEAQGRFYN